VKKFFVLIGMALSMALMGLTLSGCGAVRDAVSDIASEMLEEISDALEAAENADEPETGAADETNEANEADEYATPQQPAQAETLPASEPQPQPAREAGAQTGGFIDVDLLGQWSFVSGTFIFYFASHNDIEFFDDGTVIEHAFGEPGVFEVLPNGRLRVTGEWRPDNTFYFDFDLSLDILTITDHNGDTATWSRTGTWATTTDPAYLLGRWEFVSGDSVWYFMSYADIEFFAGGRVMEYAWHEAGRYHVYADGRLSVVGELDPDRTLYFGLEISANLLAITDHDGNRAVWRRIPHEIPEDGI